MSYLSEAYPSLYVHILEYLKMSDIIEKYMAKCKAYENENEDYLDKYSMYI